MKKYEGVSITFICFNQTDVLNASPNDGFVVPFPSDKEGWHA